MGTASDDAFRASDGSSLAAGLDSLEYATPIADDGVVYFVEKRATAALLPDSLTAGALVTTPLWESRVMGSRHCASPVIHDGLIYAISREEKLSILDAERGLVLYERRLDLGEEANSAYVSVTVAGDRLYVSTSNGTNVVLATGRTYWELARNRLEGLRSTPVFTGDRMYVRAGEYLYRIGSVGNEGQRVSAAPSAQVVPAVVLQPAAMWKASRLSSRRSVAR